MNNSLNKKFGVIQYKHLVILKIKLCGKVLWNVSEKLLLIGIFSFSFIDIIFTQFHRNTKITLNL